MYMTHCKTFLEQSWWEDAANETRKKSWCFTNAKGSAEVIILNPRLPNRHKLSPVSCCTVTRSPMSQHPLFIRNTWLVPKKPPMTSQKKCRSHVATVRDSKGDTTPLAHSNSYKIQALLGLFPLPASLSVESFETCWPLCFSPSWCLLSLPQRKVSMFNARVFPLCFWCGKSFLVCALRVANLCCHVCQSFTASTCCEYIWTLIELRGDILFLVPP